MNRHRSPWLRRVVLIALVLISLTLTLTAAHEAKAQSTVTATATVSLRIRSGPGTSYAQIGVFPGTATAPVLGRDSSSSWLLIEYRGIRGWVAAWYCRVSGDLAGVPVTNASGSGSGGTSSAPPASSSSVTATATVSLRIRSGPGTSYSQISYMNPRTTVPVLGRNAAGDWLFIEYRNVRGWVAAWYTTIQGDLATVPVTDGGSGSSASAPQPTQTQPAQTQPSGGGQVTVTINTDLNVRSGPGTGYRVLTVARRGWTLTVLGRDSSSSWAFVDCNGTRGWVSVYYTTVNGSLASVPVTNESGSPVASAPQPAPAPAPTAAPPPPPPSGGGGFELGGQTHDFSHPDLMRSAGMTWVKFQQKWEPGMDPSIVAGRINAAHAAGFRVLISAPGPAYPSSIDFNSYVQFLRGVAALGADAIEVWNEMNLNREWPSGQVSPSSYVNNMLAPAYRAIKAVRPSTLVIGGALAPTGVNMGNDIWSDDRYLAGMRDAGAASYMDCMGVHHNAGATSPDATTGHPADDGGHHYSWYFWGTFNLYAGTFPGSKLCYTEIGYLTPEGYGALPGNFAWGSGTSLAEHAEWLGRAIRLLRSSGRVRLAIVFNVDIMVWQPDDPQAGYAILRPDGSCPACSTLAAAMR